MACVAGQLLVQLARQDLIARSHGAGQAASALCIMGVLGLYAPVVPTGDHRETEHQGLREAFDRKDADAAQDVPRAPIGPGTQAAADQQCGHQERPGDHERQRQGQSHFTVSGCPWGAWSSGRQAAHRSTISTKANIAGLTTAGSNTSSWTSAHVAA